MAELASVSPQSSEGDSSFSSPSVARSNAPVDAFDCAAKSSDPFSFLMDTVVSDFLSSDSSAEESNPSSASSPSAHDSPSAADWITMKETAVNVASSNEPGLPWSASDLSSLSFDDFDGMNFMGFDPNSFGVPMHLDPMLFPHDNLALSLDPTGTQPGCIKPDLESFSFNFGASGLADPLSPSSDGLTDQSGTSSSSQSSDVSASPVVTAAQTSAPTPPPSLAQPALSSQCHQRIADVKDKQAVEELLQRAQQFVRTLNVPSFNQAKPGKLPIPRLQPSLSVPSPSSVKRKGSSTSVSSAASASSSQSTPPQTLDANASSDPTIASSAAPIRTKTSHTTIERRYRTNLNARIQSLRAAVPALRVLETKPGNRVGNLALKAGTRRAGIDVDPSTVGEEEDVMDERGFIDGVKVARKGSKANVLGKATEYIRVLKRREYRLKREQEGLKMLITSLVGGPQLVQEWEAMWRDKFGGPEKDEVEGEDGDVDYENEDDDGEEGEDGEDETGEKKRKRPKLESLETKLKSKKSPWQNPLQPSPVAAFATQSCFPFSSTSTGVLSTNTPVQPEKRKRGRPRKIPLPPVVLPSSLTPDVFSQFQQQQQQQQALDSARQMKMEIDASGFVQATSSADAQSPNPQPAQYLLAVFAFFSIANSPFSFLASSSSAHPSAHAPAHVHVHTHTGSVLGPLPDHNLVLDQHANQASSITFSFYDVVQMFHLAVSFLLLLSIVTPWLPRIARSKISRCVPSIMRPILGLGHPSVLSQASSPRKNAPMQQQQRSSSDDNDSSATNEEEKADAAARMTLLSALRNGPSYGPAAEMQVLREALGLGTGVLGLVISCIRQMSARPMKSRSRFGLERRMLEQRAFLRLAELVSLDAKASITTRIQIYLYASNFFSVFTAAVRDISTLALVVQPIWSSKGASLWTLARTRAQGKRFTAHISRAYEAFVLENMSVNEAAQRLAKLKDNASSLLRSLDKSPAGDADEDSTTSSDSYVPPGPLTLLASQTVREYVRMHAERAFLQAVSGSDEEIRSGEHNASHQNLDKECTIEEVIEAGRSLDAQTAALVDVFQRVCNPTASCISRMGDAVPILDSDSIEDDVQDTEASELRSLLHAVLLYRRIFPSRLLNVCASDVSTCAGAFPPLTGSSSSSISFMLTPIPSPPTSPSRKNVALHLGLRRCLDSAAFDRVDALEDARDRVVDMLTSESAGWTTTQRV